MEKKRRNSKTKTGAIVATVMVVLVLVGIITVYLIGSSNQKHNEYCENWITNIEERQQQLDVERQQLEQNIFRSDAEISSFNAQNLLLNEEVSKYNQECAF